MTEKTTHSFELLPDADEAAVAASAELEIDAPPAIVWDVLTTFDLWPSWNPEVKSMSVEGDVAEGTVFRWRAGPGTITSTVERVDPERRIEWSGRTLGIKALHAWDLAPRDGRTIVRTEETYDGLVAAILRRPLRRTLETALTEGLGHLRRASEQRARSDDGGS
jgi:uncharacterized protein YndB with AHSA1/START domain